MYLHFFSKDFIGRRKFCKNKKCLQNQRLQKQRYYANKYGRELDFLAKIIGLAFFQKLFLKFRLIDKKIFDFVNILNYLTGIRPKSIHIPHRHSAHPYYPDRQRAVKIELISLK